MEIQLFDCGRLFPVMDKEASRPHVSPRPTRHAPRSSHPNLLASLQQSRYTEATSQRTSRLMMNSKNSDLRRILCQFFPIFLSCTFSYAQDTGMFRGDLAHSGIYAATGVPKLNGVKWTFRTHGEVISSPAIVDGIVYIGSNDGNLYAIEEHTGSQKWSFSTEARIR